VARIPGHPGRRAPPQPWRPLGLAPRAWAAGIAALFVGFLGYGAISPWSNAFGHTYWTSHTHKKVIALTFDDGPEDPYTSQILAVLEKEHVRATFFLVGENLARNPAPARRMALDGDAIGNHTENHTAAFALEPERAQAADVDLAERTIHEVTGQYPRFFRPPQGLRSPWMMGLLARDSLVTVTWDDAPRDWEKHTPEALVRSTLAQAHPGAIVLLHDGLNLDHRADRKRHRRGAAGHHRAAAREGLRVRDPARTPARAADARRMAPRGRCPPQLRRTASRARQEGPGVSD